MKVATVGSVVRSYRKASGISQKDLAELVGMSRATLNYLESGRDIEIGASKLLALLDVLGVPFGVPTGVDHPADDKVIDQALKAVGGKAGKKISRKVLVEALTSGRVPIGLDKELEQVLEEVPDPAVLAAIRATGASSGLSAQSIWKNARALAKTVGSSRKAWLYGD
jgi:transcriptional regulator with XRE-family HTH domain